MSLWLQQWQSSKHVIHRQNDVTATYFPCYTALASCNGASHLWPLCWGEVSSVCGWTGGVFYFVPSFKRSLMGLMAEDVSPLCKKSSCDLKWKLTLKASKILTHWSLSTLLNGSSPFDMMGWWLKGPGKASFFYTQDGWNLYQNRKYSALYAW